MSIAELLNQAGKQLGDCGFFSCLLGCFLFFLYDNLIYLKCIAPSTKQETKQLQQFLLVTPNVQSNLPRFYGLHLLWRSASSLTTQLFVAMERGDNQTPQLVPTP